MVREDRPVHVPCEKARATLGDLLNRVRLDGERVVITWHGRPYAVLAPLSEGDLPASREAAA